MSKFDGALLWVTRALTAGMLAYGVWHLLAGSPKVARYIIAAAFVVAVIALISRFANQLVPAWLMCSIAVFMVLVACLGFGYDMYSKWWPWDDWMHGLSGVVFGAFGIVLIERMCQHWAPKLPIGIRVFIATLFAVFITAAWELIEFGSDQFLGSFLQQADLYDTMYDMWLGSIWGLVTATLYYGLKPVVSIRKKPTHNE